MDFFEHQDAARRKTSLLVFYFILAVALIIFAVYSVFWFLIIGGAEASGDVAQTQPPAFFIPEIFLGIAGATILVVAAGTVYKIIALSGGGESVAHMLGARPVETNTGDRDERKLLNVVEEVAIASGTNIPRVFILDADETINAFAAGFSTKDAIIGVTRGCVKQLSRDELQGVIAHEFSHILNGDMRLNIRLMGTLHGILVLGIIGYWIFRTALYSSPSRSSGSRKKEGSPIPFILLGLAIMTIGYIGVFFGKLIKSAVSRQREFLADASSVQFTRNPGGIAGALRKIGSLSSRISNPNAEQASHLFFANGLKSSLSGLMATHPPLDERIRRIDPSFAGSLDSPSPGARHAPTPATNKRGAGAQTMAAAAFAATAISRDQKIEVTSKSVLQSVGNPQAEHLVYVSELLASLPEEMRTATRNTQGAQALLYALLLDKDKKVREQQLQLLDSAEDSAVLRETRKLAGASIALPPETRLPLVDMALTTLRDLSGEQIKKLKDNLQKLAAADKKTSLFEYALLRTMLRHMESAFGGGKRRPIKYYDLAPLMPHANVVLSSLAHHGGADSAEALQVFNQGIRTLSMRPMALLPPEQCGLDAVDKSLDMLSKASPQIKKRMIAAAVECITANGRTTIAEIELLRAIADSLDCPMPPFLPAQTAA